jgi:hypothetical protein
MIAADRYDLPGGRCVQVGDATAGSRRRAVGARDRVVSRLRAAGEIADPDGLASSALAAAVGYPGSSVAFAQLLSGMERAGLIEREIRGRRTYRIRLADRGRAPAEAPPAEAPPAEAARPAARALPSAPAMRGAGPGTAGNQSGRGPEPDALAAGIDYDELARRLLVQVVRRLAAAAADVRPPEGAAPGGPRQGDLARSVASLERKLASIQSRQRKLSAENARLREQLAAAQQSLADMRQATDRSPRLDAAEVQTLERLLSSLRVGRAKREKAEAG